MNNQRAAEMRLDRKPPILDGAEWSVVCGFAPIFAGGAILFLVLYELLQPTIVPNPGVAALHMPTALRLLPAPHESDTAELVNLTSPPVPVARDALAQAGDHRSRHSPRSSALKRSRAIQRPDPVQQSSFAYRGGPKF